MIRLIDGLKKAFPEVEISVMELLKASRMPLLLPCSGLEEVSPNILPWRVVAGPDHRPPLLPHPIAGSACTGAWIAAVSASWTPIGGRSGR